MRKMVNGQIDAFQESGDDYYVATSKSFKLTEDITIEFMLLTLYVWQDHQMKKHFPTPTVS